MSQESLATRFVVLMTFGRSCESMFSGVEIEIGIEPFHQIE